MSTNIATANTNASSAEEVLETAHELKIMQTVDYYFELAKAESQDFLVWSKAPYWTVDEATALSLSKNPKLVNWLSVQPHLEISVFAKKYAALRDLITRAVTIGELQAESTPFEYMAWLKPRCSVFPENLKVAIQEFTKGLDKPFRQSAHTKEMRTLYLLIYAIAKHKFGYRADNNNHAATSIKECVQSLEYGLNIEHSTILDKIREGEKVALEKRIN